MGNATELAEVQEFTPAAVKESNQQIANIMLNTELLAQASAMAEQMASSKITVPQHLRGNPGDCYAIVLQAIQWKMNPFIVAQKTHVVNGTLGYEAQLVNALVQASGHIKGAFKYEYRGEGNELECRVGAVIKGESEVTWGEWLKSSDVTTKNSPLWKTNPKQQMGYLQVKNWVRLHFPAAILGVYTVEELQDSPARSNEPRDIGSGRPEPETYPQDKFEENLPKWRELVESGKKSADQILKMVGSKAELTDEQKDAISKLGEAEQ